MCIKEVLGCLRALKSGVTGQVVLYSCIEVMFVYIWECQKQIRYCFIFTYPLVYVSSDGHFRGQAETLVPQTDHIFSSSSPVVSTNT